MRKIYYIFQIEGALSLCKDISDTAQKARHTSFVPFASQALYRTCRAAQLLVPFQVDRQELHLELRNQQCSRMSGTGPTRTRDILPVLLRPFLPSGAAPCRAAPRRPAPRRASSWPPAWTQPMHLKNRNAQYTCQKRYSRASPHFCRSHYRLFIFLERIWET